MPLVQPQAMDSLVKQMRVRFSGVGEYNTEEPSSFKERRVPTQKTYSFKGEKKKVQNWFQRQFSGQMSGNYEANDIEHATAVAAVAYAINSLEESNHKKYNGGPETLLTKTKSKNKSREDIAISIPSRTFTGEGSVKSSEFGVPDGKEQIASTKVDTKPEPVSPMKRVPTLSDKKPLNSPSRAKPESPLPKPVRQSTTKTETSVLPKPAKQSNTKPEMSAMPKPGTPSTIKPADPLKETRRQGSTKPGSESQADAWERAKIAKIKERYERLNATIASWENKKKAKARRTLDKTESELEKRRARALQHYRNEMESIDQIAGGARAQAEEKRKNEELKAKAKANRIRSTGEIPSSCLCF